MAARKRKKPVDAKARPEGQLRQSQLVTTFGPGAMVDLVNRAVIIGGLEHWGYGREGYVPLDDARLRRSLIPRLKALDPDLDLAKEGYFRMPPSGDNDSPHPLVGVRALEFPKWFVCQLCHRLARASDGFEPHGERYRHKCSSNKAAKAVPVRFVAACKRGHLSDFPWIPFCHGGKNEGECGRPELYLREDATGDFGKIHVRCESCGARRSLSDGANAPLFDCFGDRPWLGGRAAAEACDQKLELLVRTASHAYFAQQVSALRLPEPSVDPLRQKLRQREIWKLLHRVQNEEQLNMLAELQDTVRIALEGVPLKRALAAIEAERSSDASQVEAPLRVAEYERMVGAPVEQAGIVPPVGAEFAAYRVPEQRAGLPAGVSGLIVVPELREVRVQISFSRFDSVSANLQGEFDFDRHPIPQF